MKKVFILALAVFFTVNTVSAQTCITEDFSNDPTGWTLSQGARITDYNNPLDHCNRNWGIITPGVGGNNPCNVRTPSYTSTGTTQVQMSFNILVFNANLKCDTWKDFDCETSVDVFYFVGATKHTGIIDFVLPPNGPLGTTLVTVMIPVGANLPAGTEYKIQLEFKPKSGTGHCVQQNTKYIIDNFKKCEYGVHPTFTDPISTKQSDFTITTNPANDMNELIVNTKADYDVIELLDNSGKLIRSFSNDAVVRTTGLEKGTYLIRLTKANSIVSVTKNVVLN